MDLRRAIYPGNAPGGPRNEGRPLTSVMGGAGNQGPPLRLCLLGRFELSALGEPIYVPPHLQRLLVLLALQVGPMRRASVSGVLWPEVTEARAASSLRSALCDLGTRYGCRFAVVGTRTEVGLKPGLAVDLHAAEALARRLCDDSALLDEGELDGDLFASELLPDSYDDWITPHTERHRHLRLQALESLCRRLMVARRFSDAAGAALAAITAEPLRESSHRLLVAAYEAEGNRGLAVEAYRNHCRTMMREWVCSALGCFGPAVPRGNRRKPRALDAPGPDTVSPVPGLFSI